MKDLAAMHPAIEAASKRPFSYGEHDCCLFVVSVVKAMTGEDPATFYPYSDEDEAIELMAVNGGVEGLATAQFGEPVPPNLLCRGDVGLVDIPEPALGIVTGTHVVVASRNGGTAALKRSRIIKGWRI